MEIVPIGLYRQQAAPPDLSEPREERLDALRQRRGPSSSGHQIAADVLGRRVSDAGERRRHDRQPWHSQRYGLRVSSSSVASQNASPSKRPTTLRK